MKCPVCQADSDAGASFCPHCGAKLPLFDTGQEVRSPEKMSTRPESEDPAPRAALGGRRRPVTDVSEEVLWEGSYSPKAMLGVCVGAMLASLALLVAMIVLMAGPFWIAPLGAILVLWFSVLMRLAVKRLGISYKLTNQMFYHQKGVFTRVTNRVEAIDIDDVAYEQGLFDRMVNVGRIKITSSDKTDPELWVEGIENVQEVAQKIDKARRAERIRRGVSVESI